MAANDNFTVAVELGSSEVSVIVGRKNADGGIQVLATLQEPSASFIRKGRINNVSKMKQFVTSMKDKLEKQLKMSISKVYVGLGGMGMHTVKNEVQRHYSEKALLTDHIIEELNAENRNLSSGEMTIVEVVPQEYNINSQQTLEPVGMQADHLKATFLNVMIDANALEQIGTCFYEAGLKIAGTPLCVHDLAMDITQERERSTGCAFVDMGAETTSVAVYKNKLLRHLAVIPLGGANITRDIAMHFSIEETEAEELKLKYLTGSMDDSEVENHPEITLLDGRKVRFADFYYLAKARLEEIVLNVKEQIRQAGHSSSTLLGGIILTGGAAKIKEIASLFVSSESSTNYIVAVRQSLPFQVRWDKANASENKDSFNAVLSMLDKYNENCCGGALGLQPVDLFERGNEAEVSAAANAGISSTLTEAERLVLQRKKEEEERIAAEKRAEEERIAAEVLAAQKAKEEEERRIRRENSFWNRSLRKIKELGKNMVSDDNADAE